MREAAHEISFSSSIDAVTVAKSIAIAEYFYATAIDVYENIQYGGYVSGNKIAALLDRLPETFTKQQALQMGKLLGISQSTITRHIRGDDDSFTIKIKHGVYRKKQ